MWGLCIGQFSVYSLSVAFFGQAMSSSGWATLSEVAPKGLLGIVGDIFSFLANLAGILVPIAIGFIIQPTGPCVGALAFIGIVAAVVAISWIFIIGDIRPLDISVNRARTLQPRPRRQADAASPSVLYAKPP